MSLTRWSRVGWTDVLLAAGAKSESTPTARGFFFLLFSYTPGSHPLRAPQRQLPPVGSGHLGVLPVTLQRLSGPYMPNSPQPHGSTGFPCRQLSPRFHCTKIQQLYKPPRDQAFSSDIAGLFQPIPISVATFWHELNLSYHLSLLFGQYSPYTHPLPLDTWILFSQHLTTICPQYL